MIKPRDTWFRILVIFIPALLLVYTNSLASAFTTERLAKTIVSIIATAFITEGSRFLCYGSRRWFPVNKTYRLMFTIIVGLAWTTLILMVSIWIRRYISTGAFSASIKFYTNVTLNDKRLSFGIVGYSFFNAIINFFFLMLAFDVLYHYAKLRYSEKEQERLEKEKLRAELQQLKGIINPHFLFNNLNSLSSLISEDPQRAESFLDELTKVFRYLLRNNENELTTLRQELQFIQSYYHLLQTRYGKAIRLDMKIDPAYEELMIPPLTLQLLVENAFKHNQLTIQQPLQIEITTAADNKLIVKNTVCQREGKVESTGIGLQNINARYQMLHHPGVVIEKTDRSFAVEISLI